MDQELFIRQASTHLTALFKSLWLDIETTSMFHLWWDSIKPHLESGRMEIEMLLSNSSYCPSCPLLIHGRSLNLSSLFCWHWIPNKQIGLLSRSLISTPCFNQRRETPRSILQLVRLPAFFTPLIIPLFGIGVYCRGRASWQCVDLWCQSHFFLQLVFSLCFIQHCPQRRWCVCVRGHISWQITLTWNDYGYIYPNEK